MMELMVVIVIVAVLMSLALPNYMKTVDRSRLSDAINQLSVIHSANMIYRAQHGTSFLPGSPTLNLSDINSSLGLNVIANGMTYTYWTSAPTVAFTAQAERGAYKVTVNQNPIDPSNPLCAGGSACP